MCKRPRRKRDPEENTTPQAYIGSSSIRSVCYFICTPLPTKKSVPPRNGRGSMALKRTRKNEMKLFPEWTRLRVIDKHVFFRPRTVLSKRHAELGPNAEILRKGHRSYGRHVKMPKSVACFDPFVGCDVWRETVSRPRGVETWGSRARGGQEEKKKRWQISLSKQSARPKCARRSNQPHKNCCDSVIVCVCVCVAGRV